MRTAMIELSPDEARRRLVAWQGLARAELPPGAEGARRLLHRHRCVQLDPLDRIGTNADLVALARVDGLARGQVYDALLPGHAFEHFAKERCLVPAETFPAYRARALQAPWWRLEERLQRLPEGLIAEVLDEVRARGPLAAEDLSDRGRVAAIDWSGWKGTSKAATMALEVLWTRCEVVVCDRGARGTGRKGGGKRFDLPERVLPGPAAAPTPADPTEAFLCDRVAACGLLADAAGPWWSGLREARQQGVAEALVRRGHVVRLRITGARREYLALPAFLDAAPTEPDGRLRILGPLDPLIWDRVLVEQLFGFAYVWEVYKPAAQRRWGWYVVPLLHRGHLVGRLEAHTERGRVVVDRLWSEGPGLERPALETELGRYDLPA
ncbi:winged helix DNA-binding domain-containing protein [Myxococcota bacterium]|nr:winged helix DNA-binding domain-containing protein [Myxococcota bacterium]